MRKQESGLPIIHVAAGIIWRNERLLIAKRPLNEPKGGYWEFPGGKQEPGEPIEDTLVRELQEELGITSTKVIPFTRLEHAYPDMWVCLYLFHVTEFIGEPQPLLGQDIQWVKKESLTEYDFLPADRAILPTIQKPCS